MQKIDQKDRTAEGDKIDMGLFEKINLFDEIICLKWEKVFDDVLWVEHRHLILEMKSCTDYRIQMECKKVDSFRFRGNGKISGFYVKNISPMGYETGVKYEVGDYENDEIEFYCSDIEIKSIKKN